MRRPGGKKTYQAFCEASGQSVLVKPRRKRPPPIAVRVSEGERQQIIEAAGDMSISAYAKLKLLDGRSVSARKASVDQKALAETLSRLGKSRLSSNLNQLARAADIGALPVTPDLNAELHRICDEVRALRQELLRALGLRGKQ